jgi:Recombination endonuclease VII
MSWTLWNRLPHGFLAKSFEGFDRLDHSLKVLIVELARKQNFKCAICNRNRKLVIEHDHYPDRGTGKFATIYNTRGLTCGRCNWHLMMYEKELHGEYVGFGEATSKVSDRGWEEYTYPYDCRIVALSESELAQRCPNYWPRRIFLDKFDDWREWSMPYPWRWYFDEIKDRRHGKIRNPKQLFRALAAIGQFLKNELAKNPDWEPPEELMHGLLRIKRFLGELWPIIEPRYLELKKAKEAAAGASA